MVRKFPTFLCVLRVRRDKFLGDLGKAAEIE